MDKYDEMSKYLYSLKLGETYIPNNNSGYIRVPGGWIYESMHGCVFIPYSEEFKDNK